MTSGFDVALVKPIVDALVDLFKNAKDTRLKSTAKAALSEAIRELLLAPADLKSAEAKIAVAKAAGIINADLVLAEEMVTKHKAATKPAAKKKSAAKKTPATKKKAAAKKKRVASKT